MFIDFFHYLRRRGLPVGVHEWLDLTSALGQGLAGESLAGFYELCRCLLVKREAHFDLFDQCFAEHFHGVEAPPALTDDLLNWLAKTPPPPNWSAEDLARLRSLDLEELRRRFAERLQEQKEQHDGGSHWIGTGGTSPFGHSGAHPSGIRVGGDSQRRSAVQVASERRFRPLRGDQVLDSRQFSLALRRLRLLERTGGELELDIEASIAATAKNCGDVELCWRPPRRNTVKLLLLMDIGGSMTPHALLCEQLFTAAKSLRHFKAMEVYFFHNCVYDELVRAGDQHATVSTLEVLNSVDATWHLMVVGDALMNPYELTHAGGRIDFYSHNAEPGLVWLKRIRERLPRGVWLNPESPEAWDATSVRMVRQVFREMYPLTVDGLTAAIASLGH